MSTHGAEPCCSPWFIAAAKPRFESFMMTAQARRRAVPTPSVRTATVGERSARPINSHVEYYSNSLNRYGAPPWDS